MLHIELELLLPATGLISNVALGEDRGNIEAVRRMVREHIQGQTLILLTITMRGTVCFRPAISSYSSYCQTISTTKAPLILLGQLTRTDLAQLVAFTSKLMIY